MYKRHLKKLSRTRLDDVLLDEGVIEKASIEDAQAEHEMTGKSLSHVLFEREAIDEWDLAKIVATHYSLPYIDLAAYSIDKEILSHLPIVFCQQHSLIPMDAFGEALVIAVAEMPNPVLLRKLSKLIHPLRPFLYVGLRRAIQEKLAAIDPRTDAEKKAATAVAPKPPTVPFLNREDLKPKLGARSPVVLPPGGAAAADIAAAEAAGAPQDAPPAEKSEPAVERAMEPAEAAAESESAPESVAAAKKPWESIFDVQD